MGGPSDHFAGDPYRNADGIRRVVREGLCHRCGACIGLCPVGTFTIRDGYPYPVGECIRCNICVRVCSGLEVDYPALGRLVHGEGYRFGPLTGPTRSVWIAHATDRAIRAGGASGGVATGALAHWLRRGEIRGAIVTAADPNEPARGTGFVARTVEELGRTQQSRYTTAPSFAALAQIRDEDGPFAAVGLPCQIHSLRKRQAMDPRWISRVPIVIGLLCHYNLPWEVVRLTAELFAPPGAHPVRCFSRQKDDRGWPCNTMEIHYSDGSVRRSPFSPAATFNVISRVAPLGRCLFCFDACAEFADFSVGDPWIRGPDGRWKYHSSEGFTLVFIQTEQGERLWRRLLEEGAIEGFQIPFEEFLENGQRDMIVEKKERTALRVRVCRALGRPVPRYPVALPRTSPRQLVRELLFWVTRLNTVSQRWQRLLLRIGFGPLGQWLLRRREQGRERVARRRAQRKAGAAAPRR